MEGFEGSRCSFIAGADLYDDLLKAVEGGPASPFGVEGALRNCLTGGNPAGVEDGTSGALLDRMLENDMGFEALWSSCVRGLFS